MPVKGLKNIDCFQTVDWAQADIPDPISESINGLSNGTERRESSFLKMEFEINNLFFLYSFKFLTKSSILSGITSSKNCLKRFAVVGDFPLVEIAIFTEAGLLMHTDTYQVEQNVIQINTSGLTTGIYFLRLKNDTINKSFKLIKQ